MADNEETDTGKEATATDTEAETTATETTETKESVETKAADDSAKDSTEEAADDESSKDEDAAEDQSDKDDKKDEKEDLDIKLSEDSIFSERADEFKAVLKEVGIDSTEKYEKLVSFLQEHNEKAEGKLSEATKAAENIAIDNTLKKWDEALKSDGDFGLKYDDNVKMVKTTMDSLGSDFSDWVTKNSFDRNPIVAKAMLKLGKERADADVIVGKGGTGNKPKATTAGGKPALHFPSMEK